MRSFSTIRDTDSPALASKEPRSETNAINPKGERKPKFTASNKRDRGKDRASEVTPLRLSVGEPIKGSGTVAQRE
jgi:hypothetical protein